ncbi:MAG TPA: hypothetical protein PK685_00145 [archaeon]|nr:hypothetical protein [archaeon]
MKNINTKKVIAGAAALAVGASFLGAAVAAQVDFGSPVVKGDVIGTNGMPTATIIVGNESQAADSIWAGNIAAAIASKAYTTETHTYEIPGTEGTTGTTTVSGDGKLSDDLFDLGNSRTLELDDGDYTLLGDYDVRVDDEEFGDDTINVKEKLDITSTVSFDDDKDIADLTAAIDKEGIEYRIEFTPGIDVNATDNGSPDLKFNIFGKQYTLEDYTTNTMTLVQNKATIPYTVGASFEVEDYTVTIEEILESSSSGTQYEVEMSISKDGTTLATEVYGDGDTIFDDYLDIDTEIDTVYNSRVTVVSGTSARIDLTDGQIVEDFPEIGDELWKVQFNAEGSYSSGDTVTTISFYNDDQDIRYKDDDALKVGDEISLPNNFAKINFLGLSDESSKQVIVENGYLSYTDASDDDHDIFIYEHDDSTYADGDNYTTTKEIDGKNLYFEFYTDDDLTQTGTKESGYFTVQLENDDGKFLSTASSWSWKSTATPAATEKFYFDGNASDGEADDFVGFVDITIPLYNNETKKIAYGVFLNEDTDTITELAVALKDGATDTLESSQSWTVSKIYYDIGTDDANADTYVGATNVGATTVTDTDMESMFSLTIDDSSQTAVAYIDAYTGELVDTDDSSYEAGLDQVVATGFTLNQEETDDLRFGYTTWGTKLEVDGGTFTATVPEDKLYGKVFVGNGTTTTEGTEGTDATTGSYTTTVPANVDPINLVKSDLASVAGTKIIVGGHLANKLAVGVTNDYLTQAGQWVMGKDTTTGNIVVAGFTADDTGAATRAFITAIQ